MIPSLFLAILGLIGLPITYIGIIREEKGLARRFGEDYRRYKQRFQGGFLDRGEADQSRFPLSCPTAENQLRSNDYVGD